MNKLATVVAASLLGASLVANAAVLDFNTASFVGGNSVPITTQTNPGTDGWGFINETLTYQGFTFQYVAPPPLSPVPTSHSWIWVTEGSTGSALQNNFETNTASNGFLAHGCLDNACSPVSTVSFAISNPTPFTFQSLEIGRYFSDTATINLYTNIGDAAPARTISIAPSGPPGFQPVLVSNVLYSAELFTKITIDGFKGYYGIDNIVYAPVPEASTYAMMLTGLGIVGYFARRRRM